MSLKKDKVWRADGRGYLNKYIAVAAASKRTWMGRGGRRGNGGGGDGRREGSGRDLEHSQARGGTRAGPKVPSTQVRKRPNSGSSRSEDPVRAGAAEGYEVRAGGLASM